MTDVPLFEGFDSPNDHHRPDPYAGMSPDQRRTARRRDQLAVGIHPMTSGPIHADTAATCGNCSFMRLLVRAKTYPKCVNPDVPVIGTDMRKSWPGCEHWKTDQ
jgi:hypothetical protein